MADYEFRYSPLTGRLTGNQMIEQTEQAINALASQVDSAAGQVEIISTLANEANENAATALEVADEALATTGRTYITVSTQTDANNYYDSQLIYIADSTSTNIPVADTGMLEVKTNDNKTACEQVFIADSSGDAYYRNGDITAETVGDVTTYSVTWGGWSSEPASQAYVQSELANYLPLSSVSVFVPTGVVQVFAGTTTPDGWLFCDGSAVSRVTYAALFSVIGTTYGAGDGVNTFNLPDLVDRVAVGSGSAYAIGSKGGEATHTLTTEEMATHNHTFTGSAVNTGNQSADHTHSRGTMEIGGTMTDLLGGGSLNATGAFSLSKSAANFNATSGNRSYGWFTFKASNNWTGATSGASANHTHSVTAAGSIGNSGSGTAHNNMQPYLAMRYIIKY